MSDDPIQQNLDKPGRGNGAGTKRAQFKPGYDPRRWLRGRGRKSPEQREGEAILLAVIWEELSRSFDVFYNAKGEVVNVVAKETPAETDALRLMVRQWIKKHPEQVADRVAGKVTEKVDVTSGGEKIKGYAVFNPAEWDKKDNGNT